jgi:hypothetical protein
MVTGAHQWAYAIANLLARFRGPSCCVMGMEANQADDYIATRTALNEDYEALRGLPRYRDGWLCYIPPGQYGMF